MKKFFPSSPVEVLALQSFLEEMSESGYMLTDAYGSIYKFEACEPATRRFQVDFFSKVSIFDSRPEMKTEEYIEYCKTAGWTHCLGNGKMQYFYTEDMEIPEIETNDDFRFQSITRTELWSRMPLWILSIFYAYIGLDIVRDTMNDYLQWAGFISSPIVMGFLIFFSMYAIGAVISFADFMMFYLGNKKRLNRGESINLYSPEQSKRRVRYRMIGLGILLSPLIFTTFQSASQWSITLVTLLLFVSSAVLFGLFMKSRHSNRKTNIIMLLVLVFAMVFLTNRMVLGGTSLTDTVENGIDPEDVETIRVESIPVTIEEMGFEILYDGIVYEETYMEEDQSFMASSRSFSTGIYNKNGNYRDPETDKIYPFVNVSMFESDFSWITERYQVLFMNQEDVLSDSTSVYPDLIKLGYEVYMTKEVKEEYQTTRVMFFKDDKAILIVSHEPLSEENILLLLNNI